MTQKTIQLDPDFLQPEGGKKKVSTKKPLANSDNKVKRKLLKKIKDYQNVEVKTDAKDFEDEFNTSVKFLETLSQKRTKKRLMKHNKTIKNQPPYGILKNGKKPTYRNWKISGTSNSMPAVETAIVPAVETIAPAVETIVPAVETIVPAVETIVPAVETVVPAVETAIVPAVETIVPAVETIVPAVETAIVPAVETVVPAVETAIVPKNDKTRKRKFKLGKQKNKISVLIKDRKTRKRVQDEHSQLKQNDINKIKQYLKKQNLLKAGSSAPNDVLKQMYEQSILSGDITNRNENNLVHNFLSSK